MRMRFWIKASLILPALCSAGLTAYAQQQGSSQQQTSDPVADAARKAREEKKNAQKPRRVIREGRGAINQGGQARPTAPPGREGAGQGPPAAAPPSGGKKGGAERKRGKKRK